MSRFLHRSDWPLIAAGVLAGLLTSGLVLYLFFTGIGGQSALDASLFGDSARVDSRRVTVSGRGVVAIRETGVSRRLASTQPRVQPLRGPLAWTARNVVWNERNGVRFARAEYAAGRLQTAGLAHGDIIVENVELRQPVVALREERNGSWNYERVLAELLDGDGGGNGNGETRGRPYRKPLIQVRSLRIVGGHVDVTRPDDRFALRALEGQLPVVSFSQPGIAQPYLRIARVSTTFDRPATELRLPITIANGVVHLPTGETRFELETVLLDETRLADVSGVWDPDDGGYGVTATGRAVAVRLEDIRFMAPDKLPETGTASFTWAVQPVGADGTDVRLTDLNAQSGDSRMRGAVAFVVRPEQFELRDADLQLDPLQLEIVERFLGRELPYGGALTGRVIGTGGDMRFDLNALLTTEQLQQPFNAQLTGRVRLADAGMIIQQVDVGLDRVPLAALRALAPGLPLSGVVTGQVSLRGPPDRAPLELDMRLEMGNGVAEVAGTLDLTGAVPRYDLTGNLIAVDLQTLLEPDVPPVFLTARFALAGSGTEPATADARLQLAGRFTGWQATASDTVDLDATFRSGTAYVQSLALRLATAELAGRGEWRFVEPVSGAVTYELAVASLEPFGPYLPTIRDTLAAGSFEAKGNLAGSLERMRLAGELRGAGVRVGKWAASSFASSYDVTVGAPVPDAVVELDSRGLETPMFGNYAAARLSLRLRAPDLHVEFNADQPNGGKVEILATGAIPPTGERRAMVERARVDLGRGRWLLTRPAEIRWGGADGLTVGNMELATEGSPGRVLVNGRILPLENADARLNIALFPVGELLRLLGQEPVLEGNLSGEAIVRGGTAPVVDVQFRVENGAFQQVALTRLEGQLAFRDQLLNVNVVAAMDTSGTLQLDLRLPSTLRLAASPDFDLVDGAPLEGSFTATRFTITPFASVLPRVRDLRGYIDGTARLAGTAAQPRLDGTLALSEGHVRILQVNQDFDSISGRIGFAESRIVLEELRVQSDGWLTARGDIVLEELTSPIVNLTVELDEFRPVGVPDERDAAVDGTVSLTGPPDALVLTGNLRVEDGYVVLPQMGGGLDRSLVDITRPAPAMGQQLQTVQSETWIRNLRIDNLRVRVGSNTWFLAQEARVELRGDLTVSKVGDATPVVGTLTGERGQYTLIAGPLVRRFDIVAAEVRFVGGPEPNPFIDFTARRVIIDAAGREVNVDVRITGTLDRPNIGLASGDLAAMPESELLSFLLFGQPSFELGGQVPGDALLQQTFVGGAAELLALEVERELGGVGLDIFQIRLGGMGDPFGGLGTPTLVAGRQLADDVFLTVETGVSALFGETFALRLDWAFDRRSRARLALEPVHRGRTLRPGLDLPLTPRQPKQQLLLEVRRRWEW